MIFSEKYSENFEDEDNPIYRVLMKFCIILYVIDFQPITKFIQDEILIFKELLNHTEAKVIYVFTKSSKIQKKQKK